MKTNKIAKTNSSAKADMVFNDYCEAFAEPVRKWQRKKPKQHKAFLFFTDMEAGEWYASIMGNPKAKYPTGDALMGMADAFRQQPELLGWMKACIRCAEREMRRERKTE